MHHFTVKLFVMTVAGILGDALVFSTSRNLCPPEEYCYNITLCPHTVQQWMQGNIPIICGWNKDIPMVCCSNNTMQLNNSSNVSIEDKQSRNRGKNPIRLSSISQEGIQMFTKW
ncbi:hypothetical protein CDAR_229191 [Caerostris darwini]|uniref:Uncharacterized protein n=1 Tax=Caerostris darwini TaxID=1538125 RepID=A0AAV4RV23_9ARAC|nr:hypothetical protein CDAR_229191 [Caerostris darwini]